MEVPSEQVLVVDSQAIAPLLSGRTCDLIRDEDAATIVRVIEADAFFIERSIAEVSPQYRQVIPYVVIRHSDSFFLLERTPKQTEARLHRKLSLGIGGHINPDAPSISAGLDKELHEEMAVGSAFDLRFQGILNDESTEVGRVHLGVVYLLEAKGPDVAVRETEKMTGGWTVRSELPALRGRMESWSQIVLDRLIS